MIKHAQKKFRQKPTNCLSVFGFFVGLALKGLKMKCFICNDKRFSDNNTRNEGVIGRCEMYYAKERLNE